MLRYVASQMEGMVLTLMMFLLLLLQALESSGQELVAVSVNLVDVVWGSDRPSPPCNPLLILPLKYSGEGVEGV